MKIRDWLDKAEELFFIWGKSIVEIADELSLSRKAVGGYLKACPGFSYEKERRKRKNIAGRAEYQREWDRQNRRNPFLLPSNGEKESLKREHEIAAMILSRERHFTENG